VLAKKRGCESLMAKYRGQTAGFRGQASATAGFRGQASLTDSQHPATNNTFYGLSMAELSRLASQHEANLQQLRKQSFENELGTGGWANTRSICNNCANKALRMSLEQVGWRMANTRPICNNFASKASRMSLERWVDVRETRCQFETTSQKKL
jgi:hypothetical protein